MHLTWIEKFGIDYGNGCEYFPSTCDFILLSENHAIQNFPFYVLVRDRGNETSIDYFGLMNTTEPIKFSIQACSDWNFYKKIIFDGTAYLIPGTLGTSKRIYRIKGGEQSYSESLLSFHCSTGPITTTTKLRYIESKEHYPEWTIAPDKVKNLQQWIELVDEYNKISTKINSLVPLANRLLTNIYLLENDTNKDIWKDLCGDKATESVRLISYKLVIEASNLFFDQNTSSISLANFRKNISKFAALIGDEAPEFHNQLSQLLNIFPEGEKLKSLFTQVSIYWGESEKSEPILNQPLLKVTRNKRRAHTDRRLSRQDGEGIFYRDIFPEAEEAWHGIEIATSIMSLCLWGIFQDEDKLISLPVDDVTGIPYEKHPDIETVWELYDMLPSEKFELGLE